MSPFSLDSELITNCSSYCTYHTLESQNKTTMTTTASTNPPKENNSSTSNDPRHRRITPFTPPRNNLGYDELLAKTFIDLMQIKYDRGEFDRIQRERQDRAGVAKVMRPGMIMGGLVAVGTFITLRRLPKYLMRRSLEKRDRKSVV